MENQQTNMRNKKWLVANHLKVRQVNLLERILNKLKQVIAGVLNYIHFYNNLYFNVFSRGTITYFLETQDSKFTRIVNDTHQLLTTFFYHISIDKDRKVIANLD